MYLSNSKMSAILAKKPALVIPMDIVCVNGRFNMLGCLVVA